MFGTAGTGKRVVVPDTDPGRDHVQEHPRHDQPDPEASSDGDGSWTDDPQTQDPDEDRSVDAVVERATGLDEEAPGT